MKQLIGTLGRFLGLIGAIVNRLLHVADVVLIAFNGTRLLLFPSIGGNAGRRWRRLVCGENALCLLPIGKQFFNIALFRRGANHVHGILKVAGVNRENLVAVCESLVVLLLRQIIIYVKFVSYHRHIALSGAGSEFIY